MTRYLEFACIGLAATLGLTSLPLASQSGRPIRTPRIVGGYITVYRPSGDRFSGPDTAELKAGQWYDSWVPNDYTIIKGPDGRWHAFGITHPLTSTRHIHDGEYQSFHAVAPRGALTDVLRDGAWKDAAKVLRPADRPGERPEFYAPFIIARDGLYYMLYAPNPIRLATSPDLWTWTPRGSLFSEAPDTRDPSVVFWKGDYIAVYCTGDTVGLRTSKDLRHWSQPHTILRMKNRVAPESPVLIRHNDTFYLFVCGFDGLWDGKTVQGAYQHLTRVYQSDNPLEFAEEVAELRSHAPEVFQDKQGQWFISSAEWPQRGVSIARLEWR